MTSAAHVLLYAALIVAPLASANGQDESANSSVPSAQVRNELLAARDLAWRSFFQKDAAAAVEQILAPEVVAIQASDEHWDNHASLVELAKSMGPRGPQLVRLEFPLTQIQLFGDTAILYYTYIMEQRLGERVAVEAGRGTEVFHRRDNRWIDVGWHLDSGAFRSKNGNWTRLGEPVPPPSR